MQEEIQGQIAALQAKEAALDHLASHDSLTGLPNRRVFMDRLELALARARRGGEPIALLFVDLDRFKEVNDHAGHAAGDALLRTVAQRMRGAVREADTVARMGGDEFLVLLDGAADSIAAGQVAQKLLDGLAQPVPYGGESLTIEASIGVSLCPRDGTTAGEIIAAADRAMYRAKAEGRNRYCFAGSGDAVPEVL